MDIAITPEDSGYDIAIVDEDGGFDLVVQLEDVYDITIVEE